MKRLDWCRGRGGGDGESSGDSIGYSRMVNDEDVTEL